MFGIGNDGFQVKPLTLEQAHNLLAQANSQEALALIIGLNSGISQPELFNIAKTDINYNGNTIFIWNKDRGRLIYLPPKAMERIKELVVQKNGDADYLFSYTDYTFKPVLSKWSGIVGFEVRWQTIRHSYAQNAADEQIPAKLVARNIGCTEKDLNKYYDLTPGKIGAMLRDYEKVLV